MQPKGCYYAIDHRNIKTAHFTGFRVGSRIFIRGTFSAGGDPREENTLLLNGLAETRARLAGDVERYEAVLVEVSAKLDLARRELEGCDLLLRRGDGRIDPSRIATIYSHIPGGRGILRGTMIEILKARAPDPISPSEMTSELIIRLELGFATSKARSHWQHNSVKRQLLHLRRERLVKRFPELVRRNVNTAAYWKWIGDGSPSLAHLKAQVEAEGGSVLQTDDDLA